MIIIDKSMLTVKRGMEHRDAHIVGLSLKLITNMKSWDSNLADKVEVSRDAKMFFICFYVCAWSV